MKYLKLIKKGETAPTELESGVLYYNENTEKVSCKVAQPTPTVETVDLGLSVNWMTCNIGATKPEEYGLLFQWGDTVGYNDASHSTWDTCPWGTSTPPMTTLDAEHDAASVATSGVAHMPTQANFNELTANTTSAWTTVNGVNGIKLTSTKEGYTDKYIFIPASGGAYYGSVYDRGSYGGVWSSSLFAGDPDGAWNLYFGSSYMGVGRNGRFSGYSVRGVVSK